MYAANDIVSLVFVVNVAKLSIFWSWTTLLKFKCTICWSWRPDLELYVSLLIILL